MEFLELVRNVRAMRRLKPDPVPLSVLRKVIDAGVHAASGMNSQPWAFVAVQDPEDKQFLADHYRRAIEDQFGGPVQVRGDSEAARQLRAVRYQIAHFHETPVVLLVCGLRDWPFAVPDEKRIGYGPPNYGAIYPCVQNMLLACRDLGLGATLTTMHQMFEAELHKRFDIPDEYGVVVMMPIGFPLGRFGPVRRRPAEDSTYFDRFGAASASRWGGVVDDT